MISVLLVVVSTRHTESANRLETYGSEGVGPMSTRPNSLPHLLGAAGRRRRIQKADEHLVGEQSARRVSDGCVPRQPRVRPSRPPPRSPAESALLGPRRIPARTCGGSCRRPVADPARWPRRHASTPTAPLFRWSVAPPPPRGRGIDRGRACSRSEWRARRTNAPRPRCPVYARRSQYAALCCDSRPGRAQELSS